MNNRTPVNFWRSGWSPLSDIHRDFDGFLGDFMRPATSWDSETALHAPACDVEDYGSHYLISLEIPGVSKDQISVETLDDQVIISGENRSEREHRERGTLISERRFGKFRRAFAVPAGFDASKVEASYKDGVLLVMLPKSETATRRQVRITDGENKGFFSKLLSSSSSPSDAPKEEAKSVKVVS